MTSTLDFYDEQATAYFADTVHVNMDTLHCRFLSHIPVGGLILDAGCGSGRDVKAFASKGFRVVAFDGSQAMVELATQHAEQEILLRSFADVSEQACYDGVWACASLLHLTIAELQDAIARLWATIKPGGVAYLSFKHGQGERLHDGRHFTDADESLLSSWFEVLPEFSQAEYWLTPDQRPGRSDEWINALVFRQHLTPAKLVTGGENPFLPHLCAAIRQASEIDVGVAFTKVTGLRLLLPDLHDALRARQGASIGPARIRFLTSDYLDVTDPEALRLLLLLQEQGAQVRIFEARNTSFHLKTYLFARFDRMGQMSGTAFVGSSNISRQALQDGLEWNYRIDYPDDSGFLETRDQFERLFSHPNTLLLNDAWIERYEARRVPRPLAIAPGSDEREPPPEPNPVQAEALAALALTRSEGFRRGLVVLATGLGKTWLAAFDAGQTGARRVLFIAHREEILNQAAETFLRIRPTARTGFYMGSVRDVDVDILCASVQTLTLADRVPSRRRKYCGDAQAVRQLVPIRPGNA